MVSTEKGSGKHFGEFPNYGDEKMMTQGLREMNLHVHDCDDWLVINKEANVRAMNDPRVAPNSGHIAWGQPAMLGRPRAGEQVPWSSFHTPNAGVMCRPTNLVNINQNGMTMGKLVGHPPLRNGWGVNGFGDHMNSYAGMPSKNTGLVAPVIVIDSSDDEEQGDYSGGDKYVTDRKVRTKGVSQGLTSDSRGHPSAIPGPYMNRVNPPSGVLRPAFGNHGRNPAGRGVIHHPGTRPRSHHPSWWEFLTQPSRCEWEINKNGKSISKVKSNDGGFSSKDDFDDDFSDEDVDREDDVTRANWSHQSRRPVHGQVGVDMPMNKHSNFTTVQSSAGREVIPQPGSHPLPNPSRCRWELNKNGKGISKVKSNDGGFSTKGDGDYSGGEKYVTNRKARTKDVSQGLTSDSRGHPSAIPGPYMNRVNPPSGVLRPACGNHGRSPAGRGVIHQPGTHPRSHHPSWWELLSQPSRFELEINKNGNSISKVKSNDGGFSAEDDGNYSDEDVDWEDNSCKMSATSGGLKREILSEAESSDFDDEEDSQFDDNEFDELESRPAAESFETKSERLGTECEPKTLDSRSLAWRMKQKRESLGTKDEQLVAESFKKKCESLGKEIEENCYVRQSSKFKEGEKEKKQCGKPLNESSEATDVCTGKVLQKETQKVAEQPNANMSVFEDCKNRVKELAKLIRFHITSKNEGDPCADVGKQVMKIHEELLEMKKRHHKEEQELLREYDAALTRFMEKLTVVECDLDASEEL